MFCQKGKNRTKKKLMRRQIFPCRNLSLKKNNKKRSVNSAMLKKENSQHDKGSLNSSVYLLYMKIQYKEQMD